MLKNYFVIGWRSLVRQKSLSFINMTSLSLAILCMSFVFVYLKKELSFDSFHHDAANIYRMARFTYDQDKTVLEKDAYLPAPFGPALVQNFPQVKDVVRMSAITLTLRRNQNFFEQEVLFADPSFFDVFTFPLTQGNNQTALSDINSVVLNSEVAAKLFPGQDPMNQTVDIKIGDDYTTFVVTGVTDEIPANSSIRFDALLPLSYLLTQTEFGITGADNWNRSFLFTYVRCQPQTDIAALNEQMDKFWQKHYPDQLSSMLDQGLWQSESFMPVSYHFQNLRDIHYQPEYQGSITPAVDTAKYYLLAGIALFVLVLGCINFTLLSIGKSARRSREIGMRKVIGASRKQIIIQFWSESCLLSVFALVFSLVGISLLLPFFNDLTDSRLIVDDFLALGNLSVLFGIAIITGLLAGIYPALVISSFKPAMALKKRITVGRKSPLAQTLIVAQFAISTCFILGAVIIHQQVSFMKNADTGIEKDGVMVVAVNGLQDKDVERFRNTLTDHTFVETVSGIRFKLPIYAQAGWTHDTKQHSAHVLAADKNFIKAFGLELVQGTDFDLLQNDSSNSLIINESLASELGFKNPVGERLSGYNRKGLNEPVIIGVVKNFHFQSLENEIQPMILTINPVEARVNLMVKMDTENLSENISAISDHWRQHFPDEPFRFSFLEDDLYNEYKSEEKWGTILFTASLMNVFIACLGLIGFSTLYLSGRIKEVGIRKVLGASVLSIFNKFSADFFKLVVVAFVIALPLSWYAITQWLSTFAYRIEPGILTFLAVGFGVIMLTLVSISFQLIQATRLNPADILSEE